MYSLVIQSFGRENEYKRALFCILSLYAQVKNHEEVIVLLFTDRPEYFKPYLKEFKVQYVTLTPERIREMRGSIDFLHRIKIAVIDEAFRLTDTKLLYADSDTFFVADPTPLMNQVDEQVSYMHLCEYAFEEVRNAAMPAGKTIRDFVALIESRCFHLSDGTEIRVTPQMFSWNAGVMMFHPSHSRLIPDVYVLTEQFYPSSLNHASEQFAFSVVFQEKTSIAPCDSVNYHYWYRVKKQIIDDFLKQKLSEKWTEQDLEDKMNIIRGWAKKLPVYFEQHIWTIRDNAIQSFNEKKFGSGYKWAAKALAKDLSGDPQFIKDIFYHTKNILLGRSK